MDRVKAILFLLCSVSFLLLRSPIAAAADIANANVNSSEQISATDTINPMADDWKLTDASKENGFNFRTANDPQSKHKIMCISRTSSNNSELAEGELRSQSFDLSHLVGKTLEIRGFMRASLRGKDSKALLVYSIPDKEGKYSHATGHDKSTDWEEFRLSSKVLSASNSISLSLFLDGTGEACVKDITISLRKTMEGKLLALPEPQNLDFSQGQIGSAPNAWFVSTPIGSLNYKATIIKLPDGQNAVSLKSIPKSNTEAAMLCQRFSAANYNSKHLTIEADLKAELSGEDKASLFISPNIRLPGYLSSKRQSQPIIGNSWHHYRAETDVDPDAKLIDIGMELAGAGELCIKNVKLTATPLTSGNAAAAPLDARELGDLMAFAKLYGYLRFFDPSIQHSASWWNRYAVWATSEIAGRTKTETNRVRLLKDLSLLADPSIGISEGTASQAPNLNDPLCHWVHHGYGVEAGSINTGYFSQCIPLSPEETASSSRGQLQAELEPGITLSINEVCHDESQNKPLPLSFSDRPASWQPNGNDRATRLAGVIVAWNAFKHFYPYADVSKVDWEGYLKTILKTAAEEKSEEDFYITLGTLAAALGDDQAKAFCDDIEGAGIFSTQYTSRYIFHRVPDGKIVLSTPDRKDDMNGDSVTDVNSKPIEDELKLIESGVSAATPQWKQYKALQEMQCGPLYSEFMFAHKEKVGEIKKENSSRVPRSMPFVTTVTPTGIFTTHVTDFRPEKVSFVLPEVLYIDLTRCTKKDLQAALLQARQARGVIFDCRGELRLPVQSFIGSLTDEPVPSPQFLLPVITEPNYQNVTYDSVGFECKPQAPRVKAKCVFLANESSVGNMETALAMVQNSKLGKIFGSTTAGTAGGIAMADLPGNYHVTWTCVRTLKPDGSRFHGVGIEPDKQVPVTQDGLRTGHDEVLEAAKNEYAVAE